MARVAVVARPSQRADGHRPIFVRVTRANRKAYLATGVRLHERHWNERAAEVRRSHPDYEHLNRVLARFRRAAEEAALELTGGSSRGPVTAAAIRDRAAERLGLVGTSEEEREERPTDLLAFGREAMRGYEQRGQVASAVRYHAVLAKLASFVRLTTGRAELPFEAVTPTLLRHWADHLAQRPPAGHGNAPNTVAKNLRAVRALLYQAIREGHLGQEKNPFFHVKVRERPAHKRRLSTEELARLVALDLSKVACPIGQGRVGSPRRDAEYRGGLTLTRDAFLFALYAAGMRFGDVATLAWGQLRTEGGELRVAYTMAKTDGRASVLVVGPAAAVLDRYRHREGAKRYVFPFLDGKEGIADGAAAGDPEAAKRLMRAISSRNAQANARLKALARIADVLDERGEPDLSFHVARHSFADLARRNGWDLYSISKALRHSGLKTTERYLAGFDADALDEKMRGLF